MTTKRGASSNMWSLLHPILGASNYVSRPPPIPSKLKLDWGRLTRQLASQLASQQVHAFVCAFIPPTNLALSLYTIGGIHELIHRSTTTSRVLPQKPILDIVFQCHQSLYLSHSPIGNRPCSVTNTKCEPNIISHSLLYIYIKKKKKMLGITSVSNVTITVTLLSEFSSKFVASMTIFHSVITTMQEIPKLCFKC